MALFEWSPELEVGIEPIDADHRLMVEFANQMHAALDDAEASATVGSAINALADCTEVHFMREERMMREAGFVGLEHHRVEHRQLLDEIDALKARFAEDPASMTPEWLKGFLENWLLDHIVTQDFAAAAVIEGNQAAIDAGAEMPFGAVIDDIGGDERLPMVDWPALRILLIDDNQNFLFMLTTLIKSLGTEDVALAESGEEGYRILGRQGADLILCDWRMAGMDGVQFVRMLRRAGNETPVIMVSGYADKALKRAATEAGVDAFLEKPINARAFVRTVATVRGDILG